MTTSPSSPVLDMQNVSMRFGTQWILTNLSFTLRRGESVALFGNNGSGKSTLLKIIATLLAPTAGTFNICGWDGQRDRADNRRSLRLLTHDTQLYPLLTVREQLILAWRIRGMTPGLHKEVGILLDRLGLRDVAHQQIGTLSAGQRKRLALARLLIGDADLFLLDEPHPTLDREGRDIVNDLICEWRKAGKTILLASHDHDLTLDTADRLMILHHGRWHYDGKPIPLTSIDWAR